MSGHALLSASKSKRFLECPPSARMEEHFPDSTSKAAEEGTLAHYLSEQMLLLFLKKITKKQYDQEVDLIKKNPLYDEAMMGYCEDYTARVLGSMSKNSFLVIEKKVDFSAYVPEGNGSTDANIITGDFLDFWDLKYGKGVAVSAVDNPQLRLYALGFILDHLEIFEISRIRVNIYQPRNASGHTFEEFTKDELFHWAETYVKPRSELAWKGEGELKVGDHCTFCKAKAKCSALTTYSTELAKKDFIKPNLISDKEFIEMYQRTPLITMWAKAVHEYALEQALRGKKWPGYKLVQGKSNRVLTEQSKVEAQLLKAGYTKIYQPQQLLTFTNLEKVVDKEHYKKIVDPKLVKPKGAPTLAPESDPREIYKSPSADFQKIEVSDIGDDFLN